MADKVEALSMSHLGWVDMGTWRMGNGDLRIGNGEWRGLSSHSELGMENGKLGIEIE